MRTFSCSESPSGSGNERGDDDGAERVKAFALSVFIGLLLL